MERHFKKLIAQSVKKFNLDLNGKTVLTEAATGNYVCTPIIAAYAGAEVIAFTKNTRYGTIDEVKRQTYSLASEMSLSEKIFVIDDLDKTPWEKIDIITNTGHLRPINERILSKVRNDAVISLMYEPWEFREGEIDLEYCKKKGIMICGTNESDLRLQTMRYLGYIVLYFLLKEKKTPFSCKVIIVGTDKFTYQIEDVLKSVNYNSCVVSFDKLQDSFKNADILVVADHHDGRLILSGERPSILNNAEIPSDKMVIHICGNSDFTKAIYKHYPAEPASFGYMSFTADFIDPTAVIDLHTAGLKVSEGMMLAIKTIFKKKDYNQFIENEYPALILK